jgi:hypothetical protein
MCPKKLIRDDRWGGGYVAYPNWTEDRRNLTPAERVVWQRLFYRMKWKLWHQPPGVLKVKVRYDGYHGRSVEMSMGQLAEETGLSRLRLRSAVRGLKNKHLVLMRQRPNRNPVFEFSDPTI